MQVTSLGQSANFKFENYQVFKFGLNKTIKFKNNYFDDSLYSFQQINYQLKLNKEYSISKIVSIPCTDNEIRTLEGWSWTNNPKITVQNGISNNTYYSTVKVYPFYLTRFLELENLQI
jgi:hypothetical protein